MNDKKKNKTEEKKNVGFSEFLIIWNQRHGLKTPDIHLEIARWLEEQWSVNEKRLLLMAFRAAGKSTIVGVFVAWMLYRNPNLRILVLAAESMLARKMVRNIKRIVEMHPMTAQMKPQNADQWASDSFTVRRDLELRDPSVLARGVTGNITGCRADVVICDDVEVPNTCDSAEKREELRNRLREMAYVLVAGGAQIYVGTPHDYYSIYAREAREDIDEDKPFLEGFARKEIPVLNEKGKSAWPERYDEEIIEQIKRETGPNKFESQMMLRPVNIVDARLNPELLQYYNYEVEYDDVLGRAYLGAVKVVKSCAFWDPSTASAKGDSSVLAVAFADEKGDFYLHHMEYIRINPHSSVNDVQQQCNIVRDVMERFYLSAVHVEENGLGAVIPGILRTTMPKRSVINVTNNSSKVKRIIEAFDAPLAARRIYAHVQVRTTPFVREMREWRPERGGRDDGLDAAAGAILLLGDGAPKIYAPKVKPVWGSARANFQARTVLDV